MARETKEQNAARVAKELAERLAKEKAEYPNVLMSTLERATKMNYELEVRNGEFLVVDRDDRDNRFVLTIQYSFKSLAALHEMDWTLNTKEREAREQERRLQVRKNALAKLTAEERAELNL
jgi:hypothetical protein